MPDAPAQSPLFAQVVANNLCVGCGMCAAVCPSVARMRMNEYGAYVAEPAQGLAAPGESERARKVCPFGDRDDNEDTVGKRLFAHQPGIDHRGEVGYFLTSWVGAVTNAPDRIASSSGGITTWILRDLLANRLVDAVVCMGDARSPGLFFEYRIARSVEELDGCRKSRYYPGEVSRVIAEMRSTGERFAFAGLPCFVKALRFAAMEDERLNAQLICAISIFCGHLKTARYADYLARSCGLDESSVRAIDYRKKFEGQQPNHYVFEAQYEEQGRMQSRSIDMRKVFASSWSFNLFMPKACDYCDDVVGELADVSLGDAWLPEYLPEWRGTNIVLCRTAWLRDRLEAARARGDLQVAPLPIARVIQSAEGALRHRRQGLSFRLALDQRRGYWRPRKRVPATWGGISPFRILVQLLRMKIGRKSHEAFRRQRAKPGLAQFRRALAPWVFLHDGLYAGARWLQRIRARSRRGPDERR